MGEGKDGGRRETGKDVKRVPNDLANHHQGLKTHENQKSEAFYSTETRRCARLYAHGTSHAFASKDYVDQDRHAIREGGSLVRPRRARQSAGLTQSLDSAPEAVAGASFNVEHFQTTLMDLHDSGARPRSGTRVSRNEGKASSDRLQLEFPFSPRVAFKLSTPWSPTNMGPRRR